MTEAAATYRAQPRVLRARFEVRTPPALHVIGALLTLLALGVVALVAWAHVAHGGGPVIVYLFAALIVFAVAAWWIWSAAYRIAGGRGTVVVYSDHVELPAAWSKGVLHLPMEGLGFERRPVCVSFLFGCLVLGTVQRGDVFILRNGNRERVLSTLTSSSPTFGDDFAAALLPEGSVDRIGDLFAQFFASSQSPNQRKVQR
ncbi:MAG: hypothetical protein HOW73_48345 [Polyangiaceae bacterium]|nr:hypothetical protein [Polyangiaceae bacterium]